jgi:3-oxoadipate enol-lactonase
MLGQIRRDVAARGGAFLTYAGYHDGGGRHEGGGDVLVRDVARQPGKVASLMPHLSVNGTELYFEDTKDGDVPLLFSHGLLWSLRMYDAQVAHLRGRYRCVAYDHRGQGRSRDDDSSYDMEKLSDDAAQLIERLGIAPCFFVGLSMGGFVGLRLAARRPELLRGLVLIESAADAEPHGLKYRAMELITRRLGYSILLAPIMKIMFGRSFLRDPARAADRRAMEESILALDPARTKRALEAVVTRRGVEDLLPSIRVPTLVLHGAEDAAIVEARARRSASLIPGALWVDLPRAGHTATVEEPAAVNAALDAFLSSAMGRAVPTP